MFFFPNIQISRTVNTGSRIPAAVWLVSIARNDFDLILFSILEKALCIHIKIGITIRTVSRLFPIYVNFTIVVNPLKFNEDFLIFILLWHKEILGIFVIPTNIPSNISLAGTLLSTRLTQHCIMWQSHRISSLIPGKTPAYPILVKINFLHTVNCSFLKSLSLNQLLFRHSQTVNSLLLFPISVEELA